jgi:hypothetical protein
MNGGLFSLINPHNRGGTAITPGHENGLNRETRKKREKK